MTTWFEETRQNLDGIHMNMISVLRGISTGDEKESKQAVDTFLAHVYNLRELLEARVDEMSSWSEEGLYHIERVTLDRL